jgi:hypothetical protein
VRKLGEEKNLKMTDEPPKMNASPPTPPDVERLEDLIAKLTASIRRLEGAWIDQFGDIA